MFTHAQVHEAVDGTSADPKKMAFVVDEVSVMEPTPHASEVMDEGEESAGEAIVIGLKTRGRYRTMSRPEMSWTREKNQQVRR